jgi:hypothetical protein
MTEPSCFYCRYLTGHTSWCPAGKRAAAEPVALVPAADVIEGDVLVSTLGDGRLSRRTVTEVDHGVNRAGRVVIRTGSGSTIVEPGRLLTVERGTA